MVSSQISECRVAIDRDGVLQLLEQQVVGHGVAKSDALIQLKAELIAPAPHECRFILGTQNVFAPYLLMGAPRKLRSPEIEAVFVKHLA